MINLGKVSKATKGIKLGWSIETGTLNLGRY